MEGKCNNLELRPEKLRVMGTIDKCKYFKDIDGFHFTFNWTPTSLCPFRFICKHYKQE